MIYRLTQYDLLRLPVKKGQIYFVTDLNCLFKDFGDTISERLRFSAACVSTNYIRLNKLRPVNGKLYYVSEDNSLWLFDAGWKLKDGDVQRYNSYGYTSSGGMTPVINTDDYITSKETGDRIIDNNGLLGDGSVVVRDDNRIITGRVFKDKAHQHLTLTSYLDNGIMLCPFGSGSTYENREATGSLHLNVDSTLVGDQLQRSGVARYNGDMYIRGNIYQVVEKPYTEYDLNYTPGSQETMTHKFQYSKSSDNRVVYTAVEISVSTDTKASVRIIKYQDGIEDAVIGDNGKALYDTAVTIQSDITYEAKRSIASATEVSYTLVGPSSPTTYKLSGGAYRPEVTWSNQSSETDDSSVLASTVVEITTLMSQSSKPTVGTSIIGVWSSSPVIKGITAKLAVSLTLPMSVDYYSVVVKNKDISGKVPINDTYTLAPLLLDSSEVQIQFFSGNNLVISTKCKKSHEVNNIMTGILFVES